MNTIGFIKSDKENEKRIALIPEDTNKIENKDMVYIEQGYGLDLNISDEEYIETGCHIASRNEILTKDIIIDPKIGDAEYLKEIKNKIIFGWIHAVQNRDITDILINNKLTAYAWEDMFEDERHVFWKNNEIAGEAAVLHAITLHGIMPYDANIAILGNGNTARGAYKVLTQLGGKVTVYSRKMEKLFCKEMQNYDIIINCILWDTNRKDHIIYEKDLEKLKKGALIIDVSCDKHGGIETSIPSRIDNPIYNVNGINHYTVDHTPSIMYKTTSKQISRDCIKYIDELITEKTSPCLKKALIVRKGKILDKRINEFQGR